MNKVKVKKADLLYSLEKNLKKHKEEYLKAVEQFKVEYAENLDQMKDCVKNWFVPNRAKDVKNPLYVDMELPENHEEDYVLAIEMLQMSVDNEVELDVNQFKNFVKDEWAWSASFLANTISYSKKYR